VFVVSWVNPECAPRAEGLRTTYNAGRGTGELRRGVEGDRRAAEGQLHQAGYCLGGTLLGRDAPPTLLAKKRLAG